MVEIAQTMARRWGGGAGPQARPYEAGWRGDAGASSARRAAVESRQEEASSGVGGMRLINRGEQGSAFTSESAGDPAQQLILNVHLDPES